MWASSLLVACPVVLARWHAGLQDHLAASPHLLEVLPVSAVIGAVCSLLFLLQARWMRGMAGVPSLGHLAMCTVHVDQIRA